MEMKSAGSNEKSVADSSHIWIPTKLWSDGKGTGRGSIMPSFSLEMIS